MAMMCAHHGVSPNLASSPYMHSLLRYHWSAPSEGIVPTASATVAALSDLARVAKEKTLHALIHSSSVTLMFDGYTDVNSVKHVPFIAMNATASPQIGLVGHTAAENFEMCNADYFKSQAASVLTELMDKGVPVVSIATDNEPVLVSTHNMLQQMPRFQHILRAPCMAHTIQLCVSEFLRLPSVRPIVETVRAIIASFSLKESKREYLSAASRVRKDPRKLVRYNDTRWNSMYMCMRSIARSKAIIMACQPLRAITNSVVNFWPRLDSIILVLSAYSDCTNVVQSRACRLPECILTLHKLIERLEAASGVEGVRAIASCAALKKCVTDVLHSHVIQHRDASSLFAFAEMAVGVPPSKRLFAQPVAITANWFADWGTWFASQFAQDPPCTAVSKTQGFTDSIARENLRRFVVGLSSGRDAQIAARLEECDRTKIAELWCELVDAEESPPEGRAAMFLTHVLLSITPSEAEVERWFSIQSHVQSKVRNRLSTARVLDEAVVCMHSRLTKWRQVYWQERIRIEQFLRSDAKQVHEAAPAAAVPAPIDDPSESGGAGGESTIGELVPELLTEFDLARNDFPPTPIANLRYMQARTSQFDFVATQFEPSRDAPAVQRDRRRQA
jgi:Protein of unknown function (DUF 659)